MVERLQLIKYGVKCTFMAIPCCKNALGTVCLWLFFLLKTRNADKFTSTGGFHLMVLMNLDV